MKFQKLKFDFFLSYGLGQISSNIFYKESNWAIRVYSGYATYRPLLAIITYGDMPKERHDTGIRGVDLSRKIIRKWKGLPIDWSLRLGFIRHLEKGYQPNHNQYNIFLQAHYKKNVLGFPVNFFLGEGLSFSELVPYVEGRETKRLSQRDSNLMNYINIGFDINTLAIFPHFGHNNLTIGFAVSHRSGVYQQFKIFNNTQGGGNFVNIFTEFNF